MASARDRNAGDDNNEHQSLSEELQHVTGTEADAARIAAGQPAEDATEAVEAEVPAENIAHISDASLPSREELAAAADRAARFGSGKK
jgi:hypothetical protein